jgi:hypothetical protein
MPDQFLDPTIYHRGTEETAFDFTVLCERKPLSFPPPAERDSDRSEHWKRSTPSLAQSAKAVSSPSFPASADLPTASGAGLGSERALEAIHPFPRAKRESYSSSELPCERRSLTSMPPAERDSGRSERWKRSNPSLAQSAKAVSSPSFPASEGPSPA